MAGSDHSDDFLAGCVANFLSQVGVPLVDQTGLEPGHGLAEFAHEFREHVLLADAGELLLADLGVLKGAGHHPRGELQLVPKRDGRPGPAQGDTDVPVAERDGDIVFLGDAGGLQEFLARGDAELHAQAFLVTGQQQVHQQGGELSVANDLAQILGLKGLLLGEGLVALLVEFYAHAIRAFALDDFADQVDGLLGDMRRAHEKKTAAAEFEHADVVSIGGRGGRAALGLRFVVAQGVFPLGSGFAVGTAWGSASWPFPPSPWAWVSSGLRARRIVA